MAEKHNLLLFDDYVYDTMKRTFEVNGYLVSGSASVQGALAMIRTLAELPVLAAFVDKQFPDGEGDTIAEALMQWNPMIHMVGIGSKNVLGARAYFPKPFHPTTLLSYLNSLK